MTEQIRENILYDGREYETYSFPDLPKDLKEEAIKRQDSSSCCWRNYIGTWAIRDNKLYLNQINLSKFNEELFAEWFSGEIVIPGNLFTQPDKIYMATYSVSNHIEYPEEYTIFKFNKGALEYIKITADFIPKRKLIFFQRIFGF